MCSMTQWQEKFTRVSQTARTWGVKGATIFVSFLLCGILFLQNSAMCLQKKGKWSSWKISTWIKPVKKSSILNGVEMVENWKSIGYVVADIMTNMPHYWVLNSNEILERQESLDITYAFILPQ